MAERVGREAAQRSLVTLLQQGLTQRVVAWVHGPLGVGKSTFLAWAAVAAGANHRVQVVRVLGHPADHRRDLAGVHQVVQQLHSYLHLLPDDIAAPLQAVRRGRVERVASHLDYSLLELFSAVAAQQPLVVIIDDAHWVDDASMEVLSFVSRRSVADSLAIVVASIHTPNTNRWAPSLVLPLSSAELAVAAPKAEPTSDSGGNDLDIHDVLERLSGEARLAVAVAALAGDNTTPHGSLAVALAGEAAVAEAAAHGLLDPAGRAATPALHVNFESDDPLTLRAHDLLAELFAEREPVRAFLHRARGTMPPVGAELHAAEALAHQAALEGRTAEAVSVLEAVARHTTDPARVCESYRLAGLFEGLAAHYEAAVPWLERAMCAAPTLEWRCIVQRTKSWMDMWAGTTAMAAANELARLLDQLPADQVTLPAEVAKAWASLIALYASADMHAAVAAARRAPRHPIVDDDRAVAALFSLDHSIAPIMPSRINPMQSILSVLDVPPGMRIEALLMTGEWNGAHAEAASEVAEIRKVGVLAALGPAVSRLVFATVFRGDAKDAYGNALATLELVPEDGSLLNSAAYAGAVTGSGMAAEWAERGLRLGERHGITNFIVDAEHALGLIALVQGRYAEASTRFERCDRMMRDHGFLHPGFAYCRADIAEVAVQTGDHAAARRLVAELEVDRFSSAWTRGTASRIRGMLGEAGAFDRSLRLLTESPWEQGRTHLAWARATTGAEQAAHAAAAHQLFTHMGAVPWMEQALALLTAAGAPAPTPRPDPLEPLTDRERATVMAVAGGLSNKETARHLFISVKTVEAHLQASYRKLGLTSRTQLVALCLS